MKSHNICLYGGIHKIIPELSLLPLLIWNTVVHVKIDICLEITQELLPSTALIKGCVHDQIYASCPASVLISCRNKALFSVGCLGTSMLFHYYCLT